MRCWKRRGRKKKRNENKVDFKHTSGFASGTASSALSKRGFGIQVEYLFKGKCDSTKQVPNHAIDDHQHHVYAFSD
jgi:hypothetical protein